MSLYQKGKYWYGINRDDLRLEMIRYSRLKGYETKEFASSFCRCGNHIFYLESDENEGVARRVCTQCHHSHLIGDSAKYIEDAELEEHICICDNQQFELESAVALYDGLNDVRWYYIGCRCTICSLIGVFADWKCEGGNATEFLAKI
ncbi:hypothetical protein AWW72_10565 [Acinetobacter sp. NRRL B-65365]|uniref:hypothetical protein n=1 Tax=Acinetobacter sp. NRRL B-65365 TaxID=1785092 RepID=UPI0007A04032|nr:hypothetical protein [Acinetobacter sp. NRRL B-65365]KYQ84181.1 hypothetical protein AWW72_10565 [Acinetobacter sp. NRRL B-65365]